MVTAQNQKGENKMPTRTWHPTAAELKVRLFINYKLFGVFVKSIANTIIKGMVGVKEVDHQSGRDCDYLFVSVEENNA